MKVGSKLQSEDGTILTVIDIHQELDYGLLVTIFSVEDEASNGEDLTEDDLEDFKEIS